MKKFLNSPWTIAIGAATFSFLLSVGYDLFKGEKLFTTVHSIFIWAKVKIVTIMNLEIKLWWILAAVVVLLILLLVFVGRNDPSPKNKPDFLNYTEDHIRLWNWSWTWKFSNRDYKWHVTNLQAHCPQCDTPMFHNWDESVFQCPRCRYHAEYDNHENSNEAEAIIIDNLNRKQKSGGQT